MTRLKAALCGCFVLATVAAWAQEPGTTAADTMTAEAVAGAEPARPACPPQLDETGSPVLDADGAPLFDESPLPVLDEAGEAVLGEDGEPLTKACIIPGSETGTESGEQAETAEAEADTDTEAPAAQSAASPLIRLLDAGGPVIVILAIMAVLTLGVGLVKVAQFLWLGVGRSGFVRHSVDLIRRGAEHDALAGLDGRRNPVARVMAAALTGKLNPRMSNDLVREETTRVAQAQLDGLERGLALLSLVATIAPLLGLLGTVLGMIEAFQQMETVGDRVEPAVLAGGIWEALLTTAAGLAVAIPAAVFFTWLQRAVDVEGQRMEDAATQVFTVPLYGESPAPASAAAL